ncbi:hypothetical protein PVT67_14190 [Gallaecimonas kandeliae]|uniref:hypothetical protein n=1 Tax=Gallaecimonas kandeliae TaxID=3029055 RepID=UPI002647BBB3|nr:hypothetical protein [Gallaecimonas kandeliae]WKE64804.1 hypothetical protein PVT67_14190 [Gallaecimonas kandeliae]
MRTKQAPTWAFAALLAPALLWPSTGLGFDENHVTLNQAAKAVANYRQAPLTPQGFAAVGQVMDFAQQSPLVMVAVDDLALPWMADRQLDQQLKSVLLGAYVVGNVASQLWTHVRGNDYCAGLREVGSLVLRLKGTLGQIQQQRVEGYFSQAWHELRCMAP